ncbi:MULTISPECIES: SDR family oxidoreductase [Streptomyces]|jgi:gluconate 5-dehydrogenase|uniref:SDR family oxidoreductase n=1 Tax=Streptomyces doudnae TaxID=3075536 RepID=A0ABD5ES38_9ACTN|nr:MULTISPECIES: SDR family oxidoreductase [unclassified Streptomyces]MDT0437522.1 SDR family oxidoreductase [Streptomyces sp. DSM 41981]MYQ67151.1 SDR family oxidoreductase [Streptomyces sp. SID4950]SCE30703.1 gluconate 5-dehydrogenase [Streptomyces sp. SolWspMP-5a-2]
MGHPLFDIGGRTALVTGASRGIGLALARGLREAGCTVVLNGRDRDRLDEAAARLGDDVRTAAFDVTDGASVEAGIADVEERIGPLDILVNNAGMQLRAPLLEFADADWHRVLDTNLTGAFLVGRAAARRMTERGHGKIVNICSLQSEVVRPGIAPYAAAKGALKMLTKGMCAEWGPLGVQVNGLGPGYIETELTRPLVEDEEFGAWVRGRTPAGRWGRTEDLVGGVLFLASPAADFVGGQILYVDGGMTSVL